jgi:hypothetical protein
MIRGLLSVILAALIVALIILGIFHFAGLILWLAGILVVGVIIAAVILFIVILVFAVIVFFALFYYMAEKKPEITPGDYKLEEEKGKNE